MNAHRDAKIARLATGAVRQATGAEKIKAMDNRHIINEIAHRGRSDSAVERKGIQLKENTKRKVSGFALKLRGKIEARKESNAGMEKGDESKDGDKDGKTR